MLTAEGIDDGLQRLGAGVEVVRIQLNGEASAVVVVDGHVPAAANAEVRSFWFQNDEWRVALHFRQYFSRAVGQIHIHVVIALAVLPFLRRADQQEAFKPHILLQLANRVTLHRNPSSSS